MQSMWARGTPTGLGVATRFVELIVIASGDSICAVIGAILDPKDDSDARSSGL
jgi:hypothetical protein